MDRNRLCGGMLTPIHSGRAVSDDEGKVQFSDMIGDDTGDNISSLVGMFGNLTSLYWAWKNCTSEMIGFFESNIHLNFGLPSSKVNGAGFVEYPCVSKHYMEKFGLNDDVISHTVGTHDLVIGAGWDVSKGFVTSNRDAMAVFTGMRECHKLISDSIAEAFPELVTDMREYDDSTHGSDSNIFVMRKELLDRYCTILFEILDRLKNKSLLTDTIAEYVSQYILGIFATNYRRTTGREPLELQKTFITRPENRANRMHCYSVSDDNYAGYLGVFMTSVKLNKGDEQICYWVLSDGISDVNRTRLLQLSSDDFEVIVLDFDMCNENMDKTFRFSYWSRSTFSKLYMPDYVPSYVKKMITLDPDMICRGSLKPLYDEDLDGYWVSGVKDVFYDSCHKRLNVDTYICVGVMLVDFEALRMNGMVDIADGYITRNWDNKEKLMFGDQDVINSILSGKIRYMDNKWDALTSPEFCSSEQNKIGKTSVIVHFTGNKKPWLKNNGNPFADEYYSYLRRSAWADMPEHTGTHYRYIRRLFKNRTMNALAGGKLDAKTVSAIKSDMAIGNTEDITLIFNRCRLWNDFSILMPLFEEQARKGNNHARRCLSTVYCEGTLVDTQTKKSFYMFKQIEDSGLAWMCTSLADRLPEYYADALAEEDESYLKDVFSMLLSYSHKGNRRATVSLVNAYLHGNGTDRNPDKALEMLKAVAVLDDVHRSSFCLDASQEFGDLSDGSILSDIRQRLRDIMFGD